MPPRQTGRERFRPGRAFRGSYSVMKETTRTASKAHHKKPASTSAPSAKSKANKTASRDTKTSQRQSHAAGAEDRAPRGRVRSGVADVQPIDGGAKKRHVRRKSTGLENWTPPGPVHVGGVMRRSPGHAVHFAGVENRSHAAHLSDVQTELRPNSAVKPLHGPFPVRLKQP